MNSAYKVALERAAVWGFVLGGGTFFGALSAGGSLKAAGIAFGVTFFGTLALRGGLEGFIDSRAASPPP